jgi:hypothetical protein
MGQKQSAVEKRLDTASKTRVLALKDMKLKKIPKKAFLVDHLRTLDLSSNLLADLPPAIAGLEALQNLNLSGNRLSALPAELCGLPKLENVRRCRCGLRRMVVVGLHGRGKSTEERVKKERCGTPVPWGGLPSSLYQKGVPCGP